MVAVSRRQRRTERHVRCHAERQLDRRRRVSRASSRSGEGGNRMSRTVQQPLPPMELERVHDLVRTVAKSLHDWRALIDRARARCGLSQKAMASEMGVGTAQLSDQLAGRDGCHLSFWQELLPLIADYHGLTLNGSPQERSDAEVGRLVREAVMRVVVAR
jgi:hypothetical protein